MLLSVGCGCFPYTEKNLFQMRNSEGLDLEVHQRPLKPHFFCDLWRSQYMNIKPPPPKISQHRSAHQHTAGIGKGASIPIHTAIQELLVTGHRSGNAQLYNTSGRAGFVPPSTVHLQIWRITGQICHCRRNYQANLKEDVKFAEGKGEEGGKISRRTERQRGGGERRGELCRGKGLAAVHGPPGQAESLLEPDPPHCNLLKSIWRSCSACLEEKRTCFLLFPPCLHPQSHITCSGWHFRQP